VAVSKFDTHWVPHRWYPGWHVKSQAPWVQLGMALGPPAPEQSMHRAPQAVTVVEGTQLPPQRVVVGGQLHRFRDTSHSCPPLQLALLWHPNSQRLVRASQKKFVGHGVWLQFDGRLRQVAPSQYCAPTHDCPHAPQWA
jgi:hypothetical protein